MLNGGGHTTSLLHLVGVVGREKDIREGLVGRHNENIVGFGELDTESERGGGAKREMMSKDIQFLQFVDVKAWGGEYG